MRNTHYKLFFRTIIIAIVIIIIIYGQNNLLSISNSINRINIQNIRNIFIRLAPLEVLMVSGYIKFPQKMLPVFWVLVLIYILTAMKWPVRVAQVLVLIQIQIQQGIQPMVLMIFRMPTIVT